MSSVKKNIMDFFHPIPKIQSEKGESPEASTLETSSIRDLNIVKEVERLMTLVDKATIVPTSVLIHSNLLAYRVFKEDEEQVEYIEGLYNRYDVYTHNDYNVQARRRMDDQVWTAAHKDTFTQFQKLYLTYIQMRLRVLEGEWSEVEQQVHWRYYLNSSILQMPTENPQLIPWRAARAIAFLLGNDVVGKAQAHDWCLERKKVADKHISRQKALIQENEEELKFIENQDEEFTAEDIKYR